MKKVFLVFIVLLSVMSYGQSKKELNTAYRQEISKLKSDYDSLVTVYLTAEKQLEQSRKKVRTYLQLLDQQRRSFIEASLTMNILSNKLTALGIDLKTFLPEAEMKKYVAPSYEDVKREQSLYNEVFTYKVVYDTLQLEKTKIKEQNPLLLQLIDTYKTASERNLAVIENEKSCIRKLDSISSLLSSARVQYETVNKFHKDKNEVLNNKLKELEQNYRSKGPKGFPDSYAKVFPDVFRKETDGIKMEIKGDEDGDPFSMGKGAIDAPPVMAPPIDYIDIVDVSAEFPGGRAALMKYIKENLVYPKKAAEEGIEGKCFLKFIVAEDGSISNVKVQRGVPDCKECDEEAIRLVQAMPKWIPGKSRDVPVKQMYNLPITFQLN